MINLNDVSTQIASEIILSISKALDQTWDRLGEDVALAVTDQVLSLLVRSLVYQELALKPPRKLAAKDRQAFIESNYQAVKQRIQEGISSGFEGATKAFSGIDTQYYCQVKRVPVADKSKLC